MFTTIRELYDSMPDNVAYNVLGRYYYKWSPDSVAEEEAHLCVDLNEKLENLGYRYIDQDVPAGYYNDLRHYMNCEIEEI